MNTKEILEATGPIILFGIIAYSVYLFYRIFKSISRQNENQKQNKRLHIRVVIFAVIGFVLFFSATWLKLKQNNIFELSYNPYAGPPPMMTCFFLGSFGMTFGAILGLITRKTKNKANEE